MRMRMGAQGSGWQLPTHDDCARAPGSSARAPKTPLCTTHTHYYRVHPPHANETRKQNTCPRHRQHHQPAHTHAHAPCPAHLPQKSAQRQTLRHAQRKRQSRRPCPTNGTRPSRTSTSPLPLTQSTRARTSMSASPGMRSRSASRAKNPSSTCVPQPLPRHIDTYLSTANRHA
jgi:hypothetical protein